MPYCVICDEEFSQKRKDIGYDTCLKCGDKEASREKSRKSKCVAPAYNKGAYQYITSKDCVKNIYPNKT